MIMWTSNAVCYYKYILILCILLKNTRSPTSIVEKVKYAIIINAGSSGSRMIIFEWTEYEGISGCLPQYQIKSDKTGNHVIIKVDGGIHKFQDNVDGISPYLKKMLDVAQNEIPEELHKETPLYLFATAGMRLVNAESERKIYEKVAEEFSHYNFQFDDQSIKTLEGKFEGIYAWIAVNEMKGIFHVCDRISEHISSKKRIIIPETFGVIDMGGASAQMVFDMRGKDKEFSEMHMNFHTQLNNEVHNYDVYSHSYLGMGMDQSRKRYEQHLLYKHLEENENGESSETLVIEDPCLPGGLTVETNRASIHKDDWKSSDETEKKYSFKIKGTGSPNDCYQNNKLMMSNDKNCHQRPCAINGTRQPTKQFEDGMNFIAIGSVFMALSDIGFKQNDNYNYEHVKKLSEDVCATDWATTLEALPIEYRPMTSKQRQFKMYECYASMYVITFLHVGLLVPEDYINIFPVQKLDDQEIHWPLGALINLQNSKKHVTEIFED